MPAAQTAVATQLPADLPRTLRGTARLLGGPGTGVTRTLVDLAAARIAAGADPESVLLLTGSGRPGMAARAAMSTALLTARAPESSGVVRQPLVRSVHAYAFGVLRLAAQRVGDPPPRLITGAEQDGVIRELLGGDLEDGAPGWPAHLHPALSTAGFATELRDLLARCTERGIDPLALQRLGRTAGHPEWTAAGRFAQQYERVMLLRSAVGAAAPQATVPALGAAELVGAALEALASDPDLLAAERARIRILLVDDAQHLDPQAARLVRVLAAGAEVAVIAGDPNQSAFTFRGADPGLLLDDRWPAHTLTVSYRCAPAIARVLSGLAQQLPGHTPARETVSAIAEAGSVHARVAPTEQAEAVVVADTLRRAHLVDGVPWSQLAVIVRSVPRMGATLPRVLAAAGVPVAATIRPPLTDNALVRAMLTVLGAAVDGLTGPQAIELVTGPIGRVDPVSLRQLRRALRRRGIAPDADFGDRLISVLTDELPDGMTTAQVRPLSRIHTVLRAAVAAHTDGADPRSVLWNTWQRTGLQRRLVAAADRGGESARRAEADLEAVTALFDAADEYVTRTAGATVAGLIEHVRALQLAGPAAESMYPDEAVAILSPQQALGRQWHTVVIAGLQEGLWPNTIPRGGILGTQRLLDVLAGVGENASDRAPLVADERRLLITAIGRASHRLLVTAVDGEDAGIEDGVRVLSPFFYDIARFDTGEPEGPAPAPCSERVLSVSAVVGSLRETVCAPIGTVDEPRRALAARQLTRLAAAGVPGADPADWYGMSEPSSNEPLWSADEHSTVTLSPSVLQMLIDCPLRWLLERHGGSGERELRAALGTLVHELISEHGADESGLLARLEALWPQLPFDAPWYARNELARHRTMLETFLQWRADTRPALTEVGTEVDVDGVLESPDPDHPNIRLRGRIDRLERDVAGRLVIVDIKTGKSPVSKDDAQQHAQLATYQLAVAAGLVSQDDEPGGGRLVYLGKPGAAGATEREQDPMTADTAARWRSEIRSAAATTAGPAFTARINDGCGHCPIRSSCPAHRAADERP